MAARQINQWPFGNDVCELTIFGRTEQLREALQAGADPNTMDERYNMTLLMIAINDYKLEVVDLLLAQPGIQVNAKDTGSTALHVACAHGDRPDMLGKVLAAPGLLMNERDNGGWTPIMLAVAKRRTDAVRLMVAVNEVDLDVRDDDGRTLEELVRWWGRSD